jgi:hypothetical protein
MEIQSVLLELQIATEPWKAHLQVQELLWVVVPIGSKQP